VSDESSSFSWVIKLARVWALAMLVLVGLAIVVTAAQAVRVSLRGDDIQELLWWIVALLAEAVVGILAILFYGLVDAVVSNARAVNQAADRIQRLESLAESLHDSSRRLVDLSQMSDAAKSLLFRHREIEAMHELLHEALIRQDYAKAEALVDDVEKRMGYADQVDRMRAEIAAARETSIEQKVERALERIGKVIQGHDWVQAGRSAQRLLKLFSRNPKVAALPQRIRDARARHKRGLLQAYGEAVKAGDIDSSVELIRELDSYLTPQEAAALKDSARGVFRARLHNLGVQFAIRVTDEQWSQALGIGEQIVNEYPNSQMAAEVRWKMDTLRELAATRETAS